MMLQSVGSLFLSAELFFFHDCLLPLFRPYEPADFYQAQGLQKPRRASLLHLEYDQRNSVNRSDSLGTCVVRLAVAILTPQENTTAATMTAVETQTQTQLIWSSELFGVPLSRMSLYLVLAVLSLAFFLRSTTRKSRQSYQTALVDSCTEQCRNLAERTESFKVSVASAIANQWQARQVVDAVVFIAKETERNEKLIQAVKHCGVYSPPPWTAAPGAIGGHLQSGK